MSVLANHQLRLTRPVVGPRAGNRATARRAVTAPACKASSPNDANEDHSRANPVVGALIAGIVALTAVGPTDAALAKAKAPATATEPSTELNAAALYDKVSATNQAKVASPANDPSPVSLTAPTDAPKKTAQKSFDSFADFKAELAEDMVSAPKKEKKPTQKSFDSDAVVAKKESFASSVSSSAQKKAEDEAKYAALRSEYEAKMDRIRAERRLEEKARVAAQNAEVRAKKEAAKAKSDAIAAQNAQREAEFKAAQEAKVAAKTASQDKALKKTVAVDKKKAAAAEKKAKEAAKKKAAASAKAKKAKLLKAGKERVPGVNAPAPKAPTKVPLAPKLETTKPKEVGPKPAVEKTNPLLPEVQLAKKGEVTKSFAKKSSNSANKPAPVKKASVSKKSQGAKKSSPKKRGKKSESSPLTPLVYLGLFYLAYSFITDDE